MLWYYLAVALHVIVSFILVLVVLLQSGKSADLAGAFGGGATQTAFGSRGPASFLSKMTTAAAVVFMLTSLSLAMMSTGKAPGGKSVLETTKGQTSQKPVKTDVKLPRVPTREEILRAQEEAEAAKAKQQTASPSPSSGNESTTAKPADSGAPAKK